MKRFLAGILVWSSLLIPGISPALAEKAPSLRLATGAEWLALSAGDRMEQIVAALLLLNQNGVRASESPSELYGILYRRILSDPSAYDRPVVSVLSDYLKSSGRVIPGEPQTSQTP